MRGQASFEYIALVGIVVTLTIPLLYYGISKTTETIRINQADDTIQTITKTADNVYALGVGSKDIVIVEIPSGVTSAAVNGKTFSLFLSIFGGTSEFHANSLAYLNASAALLNNLTQKGTHRVSVETYANLSGQVNVLLGGYCGDGFCSSTENANSCSSDCSNYCGDGVCDYPNSEGCEDDYCSDCLGSQADCDVGEFCAEVDGGGVCSASGYCGDGICAYPFLEDCSNCYLDCSVPGLLCCFDPILSYYYNDDNCDIPPSVTDCGDYCKWLDYSQAKGYENGVCRQSEAQCGVHNEAYEFGGNYLCEVGPLGDFCCCIPEG